MITYLNQVLSSTKVAEDNTLFRHWTMQGDTFIADHPYYDEIVDTLRDMKDWVAEAIGRTGDIPKIRPSDIAVQSNLSQQYEFEPSIRMIHIQESRDLKILVQVVYNGLNTVNQSMQSALTDYTDKLEQHCYWLDKRTGVFTNIIE